MYEINRHEKDIEKLITRLKSELESKHLDGLILISMSKKDGAQIDAVFGGISQFEWVGVLDYVIDIVKGQTGEGEYNL